VTDAEIRSALVAIECEAAQTARVAHALRVLLDVDPTQAASARLRMRVQLLDTHSPRLRDEATMLHLEIRRPWWRRLARWLW
tara:strand:+ start:325 stop:570 length:246 start_codon:yes stop_codon:yes gene_type:complete